MGQSEVAVADMTDMFLLLLVLSRDELQGIKRESWKYNLILINKADGANKINAEMQA